MTQRKRPGCLKIGCGGLLALMVLGALAGVVGGQDAHPAPTASAAGNASPSAGADHGELLVECEQAVKARLNYPDEARFTDAFRVGLNSEIQDIGTSSLWRSTVRAKNAFGVQSSIRFVCTKTRGAEGVSLAMQD